MKHILILLITAATIAACKKDSGSPKPEPSTTNPGDTITPIDTTKPPPICYIKRYRNATYYYDSAYTLYRIQTSNGSLQFNRSGSTLTITDTYASPLVTHTATVNPEGYITYWDNKKDKVITTASYNADGYVTTITKKDYSGTIIYKELSTVVDGNTSVRKEIERLQDGTYDTVTYNSTYHLDKPNTGKIRYYEYEGNMGIFFHKPSKHLLEKETEDLRNYLYRFEYTYDRKGFPAIVTVRANGTIISNLVYEFECK